MEPKIGQVWEWDIDREHISVFTITAILPSTHEIEVLCEVFEGEGSGTVFQTPMSSFTNSNWRFLYHTTAHHYESKNIVV